MRISKDKNRYTKGRYVPEGVTYDIAIDGVLHLLMVDGFVREIRKGSYSRTKGEGEQTRQLTKICVNKLLSDVRVCSRKERRVLDLSPWLDEVGIKLCL